MPIFLAPIPQHPHKPVSPFPRCLLLYHPITLEAFTPVKVNPRKSKHPSGFPPRAGFPYGINFVFAG
jgi:hypothetical protein